MTWTFSGAIAGTPTSLRRPGRRLDVRAVWGHRHRPICPRRPAAVHAAGVDALRTAVPALAAVAGGLLVLWLLLLALLWLRRPDDLTVREALRLLPDVLRLV